MSAAEKFVCAMATCAAMARSHWFSDTSLYYRGGIQLEVLLQSARQRVLQQSLRSKVLSSENEPWLKTSGNSQLRPDAPFLRGQAALAGCFLRRRYASNRYVRQGPRWKVGST